MEPLGQQREAHDEIVRRARIYFRTGWQQLPVVPKWASLIAGPTGSGKTTIAAMAAETLSREAAGPVSTLVICTPSWIPLGAHNRGARETLGVIAEHIARHDKTILVLDELDKLISGPGGVTGNAVGGGGGDSWQSYVRAELYTAVMDGRWPPGLSLPEIEDGPDISIEALTQKLRESMFVIGIGTFQSWFDDTTARRTIGFGAEGNPEKDEITAEIVAERMPRELANRFHSSIIRLPELTPTDYQRIAREVETKLPERMRSMFREEAAKRIPGAILTKKGARFLEETVTEVLMNLPPEPTPPISVSIETPPDIDPCA